MVLSDNLFEEKSNPFFEKKIKNVDTRIFCLIKMQIDVIYPFTGKLNEF
jgi:hypothetical protein